MAGSKFCKIALVTLTIVAFALATTIAPAWAKKLNPTPEKPLKLDLHHWGSPGEAHVATFHKWAKDLEKRTGGRIKVTVICGGALGKPAEYFDLLRGGLTEIACIGFPYTPGRFPLAEIFGLPIQGPSAEVATKAFWKLRKKGFYDKELDDVKILAVWSTTPYQLLWNKEPAPRLADFKGRKIRVAGGTHSLTVKALGGIPVNISMGEVYSAMSKGIVDGALIPIGIVKPLAFQEVSKYVTKIDTCFFTMGLAMNKDTYDSLPVDIQAIINEMDANAEYSIHAGAGQDVWDQESWKLLREAGVVTHKLNPEDSAKMQELLKPIFINWAAEAQKKGLPGNEALDELYEIFKELGIKAFAK